jgi:hypothetical protein
MNDIHITVRPIPNGRWVAHAIGRDLCKSKTPFFAAARILKKEGYAETTKITMYHDGSPTAALRSTIGLASKLAVTETATKGPYLSKFSEPGVNAPF